VLQFVLVDAEFLERDLGVALVELHPHSSKTIQKQWYPIIQGSVFVFDCS
jgi:hypothetical protein